MKALVVGTFEDCDLRVDDPYASGHHARITEHGSGFAVEDLGSTNGTWVITPDGAMVRVWAKTLLHSGDRVCVGRTVLPWVA